MFKQELSSCLLILILFFSCPTAAAPSSTAPRATSTTTPGFYREDPPNIQPFITSSPASHGLRLSPKAPLSLDWRFLERRFPHEKRTLTNTAYPASTPSSASLIGALHHGHLLNRLPGVPITPPSSPFNVNALDLARHKFKYWPRPAHFDNPRRIRGSLGSAEWHRNRLFGGSLPNHNACIFSFPDEPCPYRRTRHRPSILAQEAETDNDR